MRRKIFIVDDEPGIGQLCAEFLSEKYDTLVFDHPGDAIAAFEQELPDLILTDLKMPKVSGFDLIKVIREKRPQTPVVMMSGYAQKAELMNAMDLRVVGFIEKPFHPSKMKEIIDRIMTEVEESAKVRTSREMVIKVLGGSLELNQLYKDRYIRAENKLFESDIPLYAKPEEVKSGLQSIKTEHGLEQKIEDSLSLHEKLFGKDSLKQIKDKSKAG